jgi:hypothetical protein
LVKIFLSFVSIEAVDQESWLLAVCSVIGGASDRVPEPGVVAARFLVTSDGALTGNFG